MRSYIKRLVFVVLPLIIAAAVLTVARIHADPTPTIAYFQIPTPNAYPFDVSQGPDGSMWFTEATADQIGHLAADGTITEYKLSALSTPYDIVAGPDGAMWFTEQLGNKVGRITADGTITEYELPTAQSLPTGIVVAPDGALWVTEYGANKLARITTDGQITEYGAINYPLDITNAPDGTLWTVNNTADQLVQYDLNGNIISKHAVTQYSDPIRLTAGPDGAMWFVDAYSSGNPAAGNRVGRLDPDGSFTEYPFAEPGMAYSIASGLSDNLWVAWNGDNHVSKVYEVLPNGQLIDFAYPVTFGSINKVKVDDSNNVWFTDMAHNTLVRMNPNIPLAVPSDASQPANISVTPASGFDTVDGRAKFTATVTDANGTPVHAATVRFVVTGTDELAGLCITNTQGICSYGYSGPALPGADSVQVYVDSNANDQLDVNEPVTGATQAWSVPEVTSGQVAGGGHITGTEANRDIAFGFTAKSDGSEPKGNCQLIDQAAAINLHCVSVSSMTISGNTASIFGTATVNQGGTTNYRIDVTDNGEPGTADTFKLTTSVGYSVSGPLDSGNIQLKQ